MEVPQEAVQKTITFFPKHISFLDTIDNNNISNATRQAVEQVMNSNRKQFFERYVNLFAFGVIFLALALFSQFFLFMILLVFVGVAFIGYAGGMILVNEWRKKK